MIRIKAPLSHDDVTKLRIGDKVFFDGVIWTGRSGVCKRIVDEKKDPPLDYKKHNVFCFAGPVVRKIGHRWKVLLFAPTTGSRFERWIPEMIRKCEIRCLIAKTQMGQITAKACKNYDTVQVAPLMLPGGWSLGFEKIKVRKKNWKDLGDIEASWVFEVYEYGPFTVVIDTNGKKFFDKIDERLLKNKTTLYKRLGIDRIKKFEADKMKEL